MKINIENKKLSLSEIKTNPDNPRTITGKAMDNLIKSLSEFPEMLNIREIVVDETMTVLGGNMRLLALQKSGATECAAKIVRGLTDEQKREFVIKDNAGFGQWDFDALANSWSDFPLSDWGVNLPDDFLSANDGDDEGVNQNELGEIKYQIIVNCASEQQQINLIQELEERGLVCQPLIL